MNENPRMIVANGTKDATVFERLKISRQMKTMNMRATAISTASSLPTAELTSCKLMEKSGTMKYSKWLC